MVDYGGWGGLKHRREINIHDPFECALAQLFGDRMKHDDQLCTEIWSALANQDWKHTNGDTAGYSFRAAGDLIAAIRGRGDYLDWYCNGPYATITDEIETGLGALGWSPIETVENQPQYEVQYHSGNPKMCRIKGLNLKQVPECEGGGWYTDEETAKIICEALNARK